jgi:hypothetical protein
MQTGFSGPRHAQAPVRMTAPVLCRTHQRQRAWLPMQLAVYQKRASMHDFSCTFQHKERVAQRWGCAPCACVWSKSTAKTWKLSNDRHEFARRVYRVCTGQMSFSCQYRTPMVNASGSAFSRRQCVMAVS